MCPVSSSRHVATSEDTAILQASFHLLFDRMLTRSKIVGSEYVYKVIQLFDLDVFSAHCPKTRSCVLPPATIKLCRNDRDLRSMAFSIGGHWCTSEYM